MTGAVAGTAIRVVDLTKTYRSGATDLTVFDRLCLEVKSGERVSIIGESGAGKSTLLHLLGGLDTPTSGEIYFGQNEISRFRSEELAEFRNREFGFVWQMASLLVEFTALENVMMPLLIRNVPSKEARAVSQARLDEVGLGNRAAHRAGELSGGEQQRVVLARALAGDPKVLLADEPTGNLDPRTGEMIMGLMEDLHRSHRLTTVYVTHNLSFAGRADRVLLLDRGRLVDMTGSSSLSTASSGQNESRGREPRDSGGGPYV